MNLITSKSQHEKLVIDCMRNSDAIRIAVAFLKQSGLNILRKHIITALDNGVDIIIVAGLDFAQTEPSALRELWNLCNKYKNLSLYMALPTNKGSVFHPKFYYFKKQNEGNVIIGSANFTSGGLVSNIECSVHTAGNINSQFFLAAEAFFDNTIASHYCAVATMMRIKQYEKFFIQQLDKYKEIKEKPNGQLANIKFNTEALKKYYLQYQNSRTEDNIETRKVNYFEAKKILNRIADDNKLDKQKFIPLYERLVGSKEYYNLWHSGSIYRNKTKAFDNYEYFQKLVRFIRYNKDKSPSYVFAKGKDLVANIGGCGINVVTEIMMTYNPVNFANINANPIAVLEKIAGVYFKRSRNSFNGNDYEDYCFLLKDIIKFLALDNMLEIDSYFNFIYQDLKQNGRLDK